LELPIFPNAQAVQMLTRTALYVPLGQSLQNVEPSECEYFPLGQSEQKSESVA
jgi:hypothetical protein